MKKSETVYEKALFVPDAMVKFFIHAASPCITVQQSQLPFWYDLFIKRLINHLQTRLLKIWTVLSKLRQSFNTLMSGLIQEIRKKQLIRMWLCEAPARVVDLVKASKDAASLVVHIRKNFF